MARQRAAERRAEQWAEHRRRRSDEEERQSRVMVITEFDTGDPEVTLHALAGEILKYRRALRQKRGREESTRAPDNPSLAAKAR